MDCPELERYQKLSRKVDLLLGDYSKINRIDGNSPEDVIIRQRYFNLYKQGKGLRLRSKVLALQSADILLSVVTVLVVAGGMIVAHSINIYAGIIFATTLILSYFFLATQSAYQAVRRAFAEIVDAEAELSELKARHTAESLRTVHWHNMSGKLAMVALDAKLSKAQKLTQEQLCSALNQLVRVHEAGIKIEVELKVGLTSSGITAVERQLFDGEIEETCESNENLARAIQELQRRIAQIEVCFDACRRKLCEKDGPLYRLSILERAASNRFSSVRALEETSRVVEAALSGLEQVLVSIDGDVKRLSCAAKIIAVVELADASLSCTKQLALIDAAIDENLVGFAEP